MSSAVSDWQKFGYAVSFMMAVGTTIDQNYSNISNVRKYFKYRGLNFVIIIIIFVTSLSRQIMLFAPILLLSYAHWFCLLCKVILTCKITVQCTKMIAYYFTVALQKKNLPEKLSLH